MASNNYQIAIRNWSRIGNFARQAGVPESAWRELAKRDVDNVLQGRTPMAYNEAVDAVRAAIKQQPVVEKQQTGGGILDELGNAVSDIASVPANFMRGAVDYATSLPQQLSDLPGFITGDPQVRAKYGLESGDASDPLGSIASLIRNASKVPVLSPLIPGLHTAAQLTSESGRKEIAAHPGYAALDVIAAASAAGHAGLFGEGAAEYTPKEALQQGKPVKALIRQAADLAPNFDRANYRAWLNRAGLSSDIINSVTKPLAGIDRGMKRQMVDFLSTDTMKGLASLPEVERNQLGEIAAHWGEPTTMERFSQLPEPQKQLLYNVREIVNNWRDQHLHDEELVNVPTGHGVELPYAQSSEVARKYRRASLASNILERSKNKLDTLQAEVEKRTADLTGKQGKVRYFHETPEEFAKRAPGPVSLNEIRVAADKLIASFRDLDPRQVFQHLPEGKGQLTKDLAALGGDGGLFSKLDDALAAGDVKAVRTTLTRISRVFRHNTWDETPYARVFRDYTRHLREETVKIFDRTRAHSTAARRLSTATRNLESQKATLGRVKSIADNRFGDFLREVQTSPHAKFHPIMDEAIRRNAIDLAKRVFHQNEWQDVTRKITESVSFDKLKEAFGPDHQQEITAIIDDAKNNWLDLIDQGYDPIWIQNVSSAKLQSVVHPTVLKDRYFTPPQFKDSSFNLGRSMYDVLAGVSSAAANLIREKGTRAFIDNHLMPFVKKRDDIIEPYLKIARDESGMIGEHVAGQAERLMLNDWVRFDPEKFGFGNFVSHQSEDTFIPRGIDRALSQLTDHRSIPVIGDRSTAMKVFKFSVLTGPRHLAHVVLGGMMFGLLDDAGFISKITSAHAMVKQGFYDPRLIQDFEILPEHLFELQRGKALGRIGSQVFGGPARFMQHLEESFTNTYKVAMMLQKEARGVDREAAIAEAAKTFVDMDNLNGLERAYMKQIMPFYAFTKHLLRYTLTYPADHPYATGILNNLARQSTEEWNTGLPQTMMNLFALGSPDSKGNVTTIDVRSADPFRSLYSDFTLGGVLSQLNPAFTIPFEIAGVNLLSATPDLYPELQWDPRTGQFVAVHDTTSAGYDIANAFVPEFGVVDHFAGLTDRTRSLARNNPEAFQRQLWSSLNLPLDVETMNVPYEISRNESRRFKVAQADVSAALSSGDWGRLSGYDLVPVPKYLQRLAGGSLVPVGSLRAAWERLTAGAPSGVNPRAVIKRSR